VQKRNGVSILHGRVLFLVGMGELAHIQKLGLAAQWHCLIDQPIQSNYAMTTLISASYALQRQKIAVERTLYARSAEESELAARWASAWHKLVQRKLDQDLAARHPTPPAFGGFLIQPPSRVLH
jgi:hypothetical protein